MQLVYELQQLISENHQISITFVRSHQELKKVRSDLSHIELLNIMADNLTKAARKTKRVAKYTSLPQNPIDFTINNITINSKYSIRSKKAYHSTYLRDYLKRKHSWSNKVIDSIWWKPYFNSLSKLSYPEKVIIYKFINDRLPTKARENKYYNFRDKQCNQCQCDIEDEDHILKCYSIKRHQSRTEWLTELSSYLSQNHTPAEIKQVILHNLNQLLEPSANIDIVTDPETFELNKANNQQSMIGWRHFIRGRMSIEWGKTISNHLFDEKLYHISAEKWAADLFSLNWKHILKIWKERCLEVHGDNPTVIEQNIKQRYFEEIQHIQSINQNLNHSNHDWILANLEDLQHYSSQNLQTWLYGAKIISRDNQQRLKQQKLLNSQNQIWHNNNSKPIDEPIEKGDLDPGE
jgi:hypothetical protein